MRWFVVVALVSGCDDGGGGNAECDPYDPSAPGLKCDEVFICCDGPDCWSETASGKRYEAGAEEQLICDACNVGAYTGAALGC